MTFYRAVKHVKGLKKKSWVAKRGWGRGRESTGSRVESGINRWSKESGVRARMSKAQPAQTSTRKLALEAKGQGSTSDLIM